VSNFYLHIRHLDNLYEVAFADNNIRFILVYYGTHTQRGEEVLFDSLPEKVQETIEERFQEMHLTDEGDLYSI